MKKTITMLGAAALMFAAQPAQATEIATLKVQEILQKAKAIQDIKTQTDKEGEKIKQELKKKDEALNKEGKDLEASRTKLKDDEYNKKAEAFNKKVNDLKKELKTRAAKLQEAGGHAMNEVQKKLVEIVAGIAKEKKLDAVLQKEQLVYGDDKLDITEEVLKKLDAEMSTVKIEIKK